MSITEFFIKNPKLTNSIMILICFLGFFTFKGLPRQSMPDVDFGQMTIETSYPGSSPVDVEIKVTDLIEDELEVLEGLDEINSVSIENKSVINVKINPNLPTFKQEKIKTDIRNAIDRVTKMPKEVKDKPLVEEKTSSNEPVMEVSIAADGVFDEDFLRRVAKKFEDDLRLIQGVGKIHKVGYRQKEVRILVNLEKMNQEHVSFKELVEAIHARNVKESGGVLQSGTDEKKVITFAEFQKPEDVGDCVIRSNFSGKQLRVKDVALVRNSFHDKAVLPKINGLKSINVIVKRKPGFDMISLSEEVHNLVDSYQDIFKDRNVKISVLVDYSHYVSNLLNITKNNAFMGLVLLLATLFLFLNFQTALWVALGVPVAVFGAFIMFPFFGLSVNQVVLIAIIIALGLVVDDAVVVAENINRYQQEGLSSKEAAIKGSKEMFAPLFVAILTTIMYFASLYFMTGIMGKFVFSIPTVIILMLCFSFFESFTILPCHLAHVKASAIRPMKGWMLKCIAIYASTLRFFLRNKMVFLLVFMIGFGLLTSFFVKKARFVMFPTIDSDILYVSLETEVGDSKETTLRKVQKVEKIVAKIPKSALSGFKLEVGHHNAASSNGASTNHDYWALITIFLHPAQERSIKSEAIMNGLEKDFKDLKGFSLLEVEPNREGPPVGAPVTVKLICDDISVCETFEKKILKTLREKEGVYQVDTTNRYGAKEILLHLDEIKMAQMGLTAQDVADTVKFAYQGFEATTLRRDGEEISFRVRLNDDQRGKEAMLKQLSLRNREGRLVPLSAIAKQSYVEEKESIDHYGGKRSLTITALVDETKITGGEVNKEIRNLYQEDIEKTPGVSMTFGGEEKESQKSLKRFFQSFLFGLIIIYLILMILLDSYVQPFLILSVVPIGLMGVLIAFYLHGLPMSFLGLVGTLGMLGVLVNDSLIMVSQLNSAKKKHRKMDIDILSEAAKLRFRPIVLTSVTTVVGLMPTTYGFGGYEPFLVPMVLSMSWGLVFATVGTLYVVPILYSFQK
ncbi:hypothetical protein AB834_01025 [PVC group bacterium (ex Bugula neritina AB1)]|nr:hypothetical protein AB834_01025 [PVC group bacterium (ex Bugula neritina AB1)]